MPLTLADVKTLSQDKLTNYVIDEFRKSPLLDAMVFDNTVKPQGGQSMAYVYNRVSTLPTAATRAINSEYEPQETKTKQVTVNLAVFGGSFQIDRVIAEHEKQVISDLVQFQLAQKTKATRALFCDQFINGNSAASSNQFDGLDKAIKSSSTDYTIADSLDLSTPAKIKENAAALRYHMRKLMAKMDGTPTLAIMSRDMFAVMQSVADESTGYTATRGNLGETMLKYGGITLMDIGDKPGTSDSIISTNDIYFVRIGLDGVHAVSPSGSGPVKTYLPNFSEPGAVKTGEVEMVAAMALKATRSAAVLRGIQI